MASTNLVSLPPASPIKAGMTLDRYELVCKLADGGMASVWIARQHGKHGFEKLVAVKTILPSLVHDDPLRKMFLDEARIAARIDHPNVARILDLGEEGQILYLVMEWVEGEPLAKLHRLVTQANFDFPVAVYLRIVADACGGLHAAHELRDENGAQLEVVHRDVSPQNILVSTEGHAKVIDFGIARSRGRVSEATTFGIVKGKLQYMPPEQARGEAVDRTADVWALGAMLYHFFAGRTVYTGESDVAMMTKLISRTEIDPLPDDVPEPIRALIMRALAVKQKDRFATVADFRAALEDAMNASGLSATAADVARFVEDIAGARVTDRKDRVREAIRALEKDGAVGDDAREVVTNTALQVKTGETSASDASQIHTRQLPAGARLNSASPDARPSAPSPMATAPTTERSGAKRAILGGIVLLAIGAGVFFAKKHQDGERASTTSARSASQPASSEIAPSTSASQNVEAPAPAVSAPVASASAPRPNDHPAVAVTPPTRPAHAVTAAAPAPETTSVAASPAPEPAPAPAPEPAPAPPPVVTTAAAPPPAPAPPPVAAPAPAVDPSRARVRIAGVQNEHGVPRRAVQAAVTRAAGPMTDCYRAELARNTSGPKGPGKLRIETDGAGRVTKATASVSFSPTLARCVERTVAGMRVAEVDTGEAVADVLLTFDLE